MSDIQKLVTDLIVKIEGTLNSALDNIYISTTIKVFICLYAAFAAPKIPRSLVWLFDNILFRIAMAFIIVFMAVRDPSLALLIAVAFMITLQVANTHRLYNTDLSIAAPGELSWLPSAKPDLIEQDKKTVVNTNAPVTSIPSASCPCGKETCNSANGMCPCANGNAPCHCNDSATIKAMHESMPSENLKLPVVEPMAASLVESAFTSQAQFLDAQSDLVPNSDQKSCPSTFANQHCVQGLDEITGIDNSESYSAF